VGGSGRHEASGYGQPQVAHAVHLRSVWLHRGASEGPRAPRRRGRGQGCRPARKGDDTVIITGFSSRDEPAHQPLPWVRGWSLWSLPQHAVAVPLAVECTAGVLAGAAWLTAGVPSAAEWVRWLILAMLAIGYTEATSRIEVLYRYLSVGHGPMTTMVGVWAVPAALVLPTGLAALLNVVVTAHLLTWTARTAATRLHRELYTGATGVLATLTAAAIATASGAREAFWTSGWTATAAAGVVAAVLAYSLVNAGLVIAGMYAAVRPGADPDAVAQPG
jgi:hypothetical protein